MNTFKKISLIILFFIFLLISGCSQNPGNENNNESGFDQYKLLALNNKLENPGSDGNLINEIKEFKSFSEEFFNLWAMYIDRTSLLLESFNKKDISFDEKIEYAVILEEEYKDFKENLEKISYPEIASKAYETALSAISYRILFFESFLEGEGIEKLNEIENQAYIFETLFWEEIDKIYEYLDIQTKEQGLSKDYDLIVSSN